MKNIMGFRVFITTFPLQLLLFLVNVSKTRCNRQKRISDSGSTENTSLWEKYFFNVQLYAVKPYIQITWLYLQCCSLTRNEKEANILLIPTLICEVQKIFARWHLQHNFHCKHLNTEFLIC